MRNWERPKRNMREEIDMEQPISSCIPWNVLVYLTIKYNKRINGVA